MNRGTPPPVYLRLVNWACEGQENPYVTGKALHIGTQRELRKEGE